MTLQDFGSFESPAPHPGEILREDYLAPLQMTPNGLAKAMRLKDRTRVERLVRGATRVTADTALRLGRVFNTSPQFWMNLQTQHDLSVAALVARDELAAIEPIHMGS